MNTFTSAVSQNQNASNRSTTNNGGTSFKTTKSSLVDLFFLLGAVRKNGFSSVVQVFDDAMKEDPRITLQMMLYARDIRGGQGERKFVRDALLHIERNYPQYVSRMIPVLAEFGRWDDLLIFQHPDNRQAAYAVIAEALKAGNGLCAKWMPRVYRLKGDVESRSNVKQVRRGVVKSDIVRGKRINRNSTTNKNRIRNNQIANELAKFMGLSSKEYRKLIVGLSNTVEQVMSSQNWSSISYDKLPSVAGFRYVEAFKRNDTARYMDFVAKLEKGEVTINASTLYPHQLVDTMLHYGHRLANIDTKQRVAIQQWDALPDYIDGAGNILPMIDTSSSMNTSVDGSITAMTIAIALGLYCTTHQTGAYKNMWLNFDASPKMFQLTGTKLDELLRSLSNHGDDWGGNTDINKAFRSILDVAIKNNVPANEMPETLLILSDMEFDSSQRGGWSDEVTKYDLTAYHNAKALFESNGYELPKVIFWNLNGRVNNNPVTYNQQNVGMVSGFSPSIMKSVLTGKFNDPLELVLEAVDVPRYQVLGQF